MARTGKKVCYLLAMMFSCPLFGQVVINTSEVGYYYQCCSNNVLSSSWPSTVINSIINDRDDRDYAPDEFCINTEDIQASFYFTGENQIVTMFTDGSVGNIFHEMRHGGQYARGEIGKLSQWALEISAYRAQLAVSGIIEYMSEEKLRESIIMQFLSHGAPAYENDLLMKKIGSFKEINQSFLEDIIAVEGPYYIGLYTGRIIQ